MADIRDKIRTCDEEIAAGMPKIEHRECPSAQLEKKCMFGMCRKTEAYIYNRTLDAAHKKLQLLLELGVDGQTELPAALMEVYKISLIALAAKTMLSGITWFYKPSDPRVFKKEAFELASAMGEPYIGNYWAEANRLEKLETFY